MAMRRRLWSLLAAVFLNGCYNFDRTDAAMSSSAVQPRTLAGDELRGALAGKRLMIGDAGAFEQFCESGVWYMGNVRHPVVGRYVVSEDQVCVWRRSDERLCRRLYLNTAGDFFVEEIDSDRGLIPVHIVRPDASPC